MQRQAGRTWICVTCRMQVLIHVHTVPAGAGKEGELWGYCSPAGLAHGVHRDFGLCSPPQPLLEDAVLWHDCPNTWYLDGKGLLLSEMNHCLYTPFYWVQLQLRSWKNIRGNGMNSRKKLLTSQETWCFYVKVWWGFSPPWLKYYYTQCGL